MISKFNNSTNNKFNNNTNPTIKTAATILQATGGYKVAITNIFISRRNNPNNNNLRLMVVKIR